MKIDRSKLTITVILFFLACLLYLSGFFKQTDSRLSDYGFIQKRPGGNILEIAIIEITEECLQNISPWPFRRSVIAAGTEKIMAAGARTLAIGFPLSSKSDPAEDNSLYNAVLKYSQNIILPAEVIEKNAGDGANLSVEKYLLRSFCQVPKKDYPALNSPCALLGLENGSQSAGETLKNTRLLNTGISNGSMPVEILGLAAAENYMNKTGGGRTIPENIRNGEFFINYYASTADSPFIKLKFSKLLFMDTDEVSDMVSGRLVFISPAMNSNTFRVRTPFGPMNETEVHATIAANIIKNSYSYKMPFAYLFVILALITAALDIYLSFSWSVSRALKKNFINTLIRISSDLIFYAAALAAVYFSWRALLEKNLFMDATVLAMMVTAQIPTVRFYQNFIFMSEEEKLKDLQRKFGALIKQYVSNSTYESVLISAAKGSSTEAERCELTVFFVDIVSFTTLSEKKDAAEIVEMLNDFFSFTSYVIQKNNGDIDKFIGDCVMATFKDAADSVKAARELLNEGMPRLNELLASKSMPAISVRIGMNTGELIRGDIGSDIRKDMTVIGDTVNTASRIQSEAEPGNFAVSESTLKKSMAEGFVFVKEILLKGKSVPTKIYKPEKL